MSTYQRPLEPWSPVVPDQQPKPPIRYIRENFQGTGQDSHTLPPSQDPAMWQALTNVQPITKGVIERRWGFANFANGLTAVTRLVSFQRDSDGLRTILSQGQGQVQALNEDGSLYSNVFSPAGSIVRSASSRNYQYFYDGLSSDLVKWNGNNSPIAGVDVSKWGININDITSNQAGGGSTATTFASTGATVIADLHDRGRPWNTPTNAKTSNNIGTTNSFSSGVVTPLYTNTLEGTGMGLAVPGGTIVGITATVKMSVGGTFRALNTFVNLVKNGVDYGTSLGVTLSSSTSGYQSFSLGGPTSLWGGTWSLADVNSANFGFKIYSLGFPVVTRGDFQDVNGFPHHSPDTYNLTANINIDWITITIYTSSGGGTSASSGSGIGITSIGGGGLVTLTIGRTYYLAFFNNTTGHFSDLSPPTPSTGPTNAAQINLLLATSNDPQVTHKYLLATLDGNDPTILYQLAELTNDVTTYIDNIPDTTLASNQILLYTDQTGVEFGLSLNNPPPSGTLCVKHQGRLWMAGVSGATHSVYFSKSISDLTLPNGFVAGKYEEAWPGDNYFDISDGAESVSGLLSDGTSLYIGSQNHVRRLIGDDPLNFQLPQIVHPHVGVLNQEVWQLVFTQGSPAGGIWLTPDFRVIQSDFNTYLDIGAPIQDILNLIQASAGTLAHAAFVADGEYDLYILAVPFTQTGYCDLHLVYDMRHQKWFVWQPTNGSLAILNNVSSSGIPQWLFIDGSGTKVNQYSASASDDNGTPFTVSALTSWLSLGEPSQRKVLNEIEYDGDSAMTLSVFGALQQSDFTTPLPMVSAMSSVRGPLGTQKFFVAAKAIKARYHQFLFQSTSTAGTMLGSYNIETVPFNDL